MSAIIRKDKPAESPIKTLGPNIPEGPLKRVSDFLDFSSSVRLCKVDSKLAANLKNEHFWQVLLAKDYPGPVPPDPTTYKTHNLIVNKIMTKAFDPEIDSPDGAHYQLESFHFIAAIHRSLSIENEERKNSSLERILTRFERHLKIEKNRLEAEKGVSKIKDPDLKMGLSIIIHVLCLTGPNTEENKTALREAEQNTLLITDETLKIICLKTIASGFAKVDNLDERDRILKQIARRYLSKNLLNTAERIALLISDEEAQDSILRNIVRINMKNKNLPEAERVTTLISDDRKKSLLFKSIAYKHLKLHHQAEAERVAKLIPDGVIRYGCLFHILPFYKLAGIWIKNNPKYVLGVVLLQTAETVRNYFLRSF
jgi:hypothetical protein